MKTSRGEQKIIDILKSEGILFEREYSFPDLKTLRGGRPRFDFAIFNDKGQLDCLIEYDGEQHFKQGSIYRQKDFKYRTATDRQKNSYTLANDIPLYRIPYTDYNRIASYQDLTQKKYRVTTKWHNDNLRFNVEM